MTSGFGRGLERGGCMEGIIREIQDRRSIRKYLDKPVSKEDIEKVVEAARLAPSGNNTQPWKFVVITDPEAKAKIVAADHDQSWMNTAPVFIACITDPRCRVEEEELGLVDETHQRFEVKQTIRDTAIAIGYMMLQAEHLGLSTCWTGWYDQKDMKEALGIPDCLFVTGVLTLGYADGKKSPRPRKELDEILRYEKWEEGWGDGQKVFRK